MADQGIEEDCGVMDGMVSLKNFQKGRYDSVQPEDVDCGYCFADDGRILCKRSKEPMGCEIFYKLAEAVGRMEDNPD